MSLDRRIILIVLGAVLALIAYFVGFPMTALGVLAGLPVGLLNYQMVFAVRQQWTQAEQGQAGEQASALAQRMMLRLVISGAALFFASQLGAEFLIGVLIGVVIEMLSYMQDAFRTFFGFGRKG